MSDMDCYSYKSEDEGSDYEISDEEEYISDQEIPEQKENLPFKVLSISEIRDEFNLIVNDIASKTALSSGICIALLVKLGWNKDKMLDKFFRFESVDKLLSEFNVLQLDENSTDVFGKCNVCFDDCQLVPLSCGHIFCQDCWRQYLMNKIVNEKVSNVNCMGDKCKGTLPAEVIKSLLNDDTAFEEYNQLIINAFIQFNKSTKFCPGNNCDLVVLQTSICDVFDVKCNCGETFCLQCEHYEAHDPIDCVRLEKWMSKCDEDNENLKWMKAHSTKRCPKCKSMIEKNLGCNHMSCRSPGCNHEFCWLCFGDWSNHRACNRAEVKPQGNEDKEEMDIYLHYIGRFMEHKNSLNLEKPLKEQLYKKFITFNVTDSFSINTLTCIDESIQTLIQSRRTLMYTYAFANFIKPNHQKTIFELNQEYLETDVEKLSGLLGPGFEFDTNQDLVIWNENVKNLNSILKHRSAILLEHVKDGNQQSQWDYKL